jgi:glycosyltransferase involved in cell wall biosynthesis
LRNREIVMLTPHGDPLGRIGEPDIGGQCVYIRELAKHLSLKGLSVKVFTRDRREGKPEIESFADTAVVIRVPCGPEGFIPKEEILPHLNDFAGVVSGHIDGSEILHSHYWDGGHVASLLHNDQPWFHSTHSLGKVKQMSLPDSSRYQYVDRLRIEEEVYQGCDQVFALTEIEKEQIVTLYDVASSRIRVIPPGVDISVFQPHSNPTQCRSELGLPDRATVLTLGRLDERKGFDLYVRAASEIAKNKTIPEGSFVLSAGDGSPQEEEEHQKLTHLIDTLSLEATFIWLPVLPEETIPSYYGAADVFVLPSRYEPFGIVMLEAMASGVPVVATSNGGPAKVIDHGIDGLLGNPENPHEFAELIASLIRSPDMRRAFGHKARQKVERDYSWAAIADRFCNAYEVGTQGGHHAG